MKKKYRSGKDYFISFTTGYKAHCPIKSLSENREEKGG